MRPSRKLFLPILFFIASIAISFSFESLVNFVNPITVVAYSANSCTGQILISSVQGGSGPIGDGYRYQWYKQNPTNPAVYTELEGEITRRLNVAGYGVPGVFKVRITDPAGNFIEPEYPISEPFPLVGQTIFSGLVCSDDPNSGTLIFLFQNGSDPYTWTLTKTPSGPSRTGTLTGSETLIVNALTAGTYNLTWSDQDGCTGQKEIIIASATPITTQVNQTNVTCPGGSNGTATFNLSGGWGTPYAIKIVRVVGSVETTVLNWTNLGTATTYTANGLPAGTYKVYYYDRIKNAPISTTYGYNVISPLLYPICAKFQTFTITEPAPFSVPVTQSAAVCQGDTNGFLTLVPTGGSPPYRITFYSGHFADPLVPVVGSGMATIGQQETGVTSGQTVTKNGLAAGQYAIQLIDVNNCIYSGNFTILENPKGQVNATADNAYCAGSPVTAAFSTTNVGGTTTYSWTNSNPSIGLAATGTGNISFTSTNTTNVPIQGTVTVTPTYTANGVSCPGPSDTFIITVNPKPVIQNSTPEICSGDTFSVSPANSGATIVPANTTYTWTISTNNSVTGQSAQSTGQTSISQTLTNISNTVQTVTYTVTPTSGAAGNCVGANFQVVVTVNPKPQVSNETISACSNAPISYTATNGGGTNNTNIVPANTKYTWIIKTDDTDITGKSAQATAQASFTQTLRNTSNTQQTIVYTLTPISGTCAGTPFDLTVLVDPTPEIAAKTDAICSGGTFSVSPENAGNGALDIVPAGTTYTWTVADNGSVTGETANSTAAANISQQLTNTSNTVQAVTYTVTPRSGNCVGATFQVVVTVNPKPTIANETIASCSNALITYTAANGGTNNNIVPTNTKYTWTIKTNNTNITGQTAQPAEQNNFTQTLRNITNAQETIVYTLTPISGTCAGAAFDLTVQVNPTPEIANETIAACSNAPITYTATNGGGITNNNIVPTNTLYTWTIKTDNANITGKSAQATAQSTFTQTLRNTTNTPKDIIYTLTPKSGTCTGAAFDLTVTVNPTPEIAAKTATICSGAAFTVNPTNTVVNGVGDIVPANTTYTWAVTPNANVTGEADEPAAQTSISQTLINNTNTVQTVTYTVTPKSGLAGNCVGATFQVVVTVNPKPSVNTAQSRVVCSNSTLTYSVTNGGGNIIPSGTRYIWTIQSDNTDITGQSAETISKSNFTQTLRNKTIDPQTIVYSITPISNNGTCVGTAFDLTVTVNPTPEVAAKTTAICSGGTFNVSPINAGSGALDIVPAGTTYSWTVVDNPLVTGEAEETNFQANISQTLTNTSNTVQTVVYTVTPRSGATGNCFGQEFQVSVQVNPKPFVQPIAQTFCSGSPFTITPANGSGNIVPTGTTYSWTFVDNANVTGEANGTNQANLTQTLTNSTTTPQVVTYTVTPTSGATGNCVGSSFTVTITVNPTIQITNKTPAAICSRSSFTVQPVDGVDGDFVPNGMLYTWTVAPNANIEGASNQTTPQASISQTLRNKTNSPETVVYTVTPIYGASCSGGTFSITVTVNPTPEVAAKSDTICSGGTFTLSPTNTVANGIGDIVPANTTYTWTVAANANVTGQSDQPTGQATISQTLTNISNTVQTVTYTVTPRSGATGNCVGATFQLLVTVNPRPQVANQTIEACSRAPISYTATQGINGNIVPAGTQYTWTIKTDNNLITGQGVQTTAQASFTQTLRNTTNTQKTIVYTLTPSIGTCVGNAFDLTVLVNPTPEIAAKTTAICSAETFNVSPADAVVNGVGDIVPAGTTYTWTVAINNSVNGESSISSDQPTISQQLTNLTNVPQTVIYTVTPKSGVVGNYCTGQPFQVSVQVNPKPFVLPIPQTVCSASPFTITPLDGNGNIVPTGTTYSWTFADNASVTGEAIGTAQTNFNQTLTNTTTTPQVVTYTVTPTSGDAGNCVGSPFTVTITVNPTPVIANITDTICSNTSFTVTPQNGSGNIVPTGTTYIWTVTPNTNVEGESNQTTAQNNISQPLRNTTNTVQTVVYQVTPRLGTCAGTPFQVTVTVNPTPEIENTTAIICSGDPFTISPTNTVVNGVGNIVPANTTYTWIVVDNTNVTGDIGQSNPQTSISQTLTNTSNTAQTVTYTVTPTSGTCVGQTFQVLVTVNPRPLVANQTIEACSRASISYTATQGVNGNIVPAGTQYTWTIKTDNANITGQSVQATAQATFTQTLRNTTNSQKTIVYTLTPSIGTCVGNAFDLTVLVNPTPEIAAKTTAICSAETFNVSPADAVVNGVGDIVPAGTTYTWTVAINNSVNGESSISTDQPTISQQLTNLTNVPQTVIYTVTPKSGVVGNYCTGQPFQVSVQVNPKPFVLPITETVCSASPFTISPANGNGNIVPTGTTYSWTFADNTNVTGEAIGTNQANFNQTLTNLTTSPQQVTYTVTPRSGDTGNCVGSPFTVTITVNPTPVIANITTTTCSNTSFLVTPQDGNVVSGNIVPAGTTYTWTVTANANVEGESNQTVAQTNISQLLRNTTNTVQTVVYQVTPRLGTCAGTPFQVTVTVNPTPEIENTTAIICSGDPFTISPTNTVVNGIGNIVPANTTYTWTVATNNSVTGQSDQATGQATISQTLTNISNTVQTVTYTVTPRSGAAGNCVGATFQVAVTVNPRPRVANETIATCSNTQINYTATNGGPNNNIVPTNTQYTWTIKTNNTSITGQSAQVTAQAAFIQTLRNTTNTQQSITYTLTPSIGACVGNAFDLTVQVNPTPEIAAKTAVICSEGTFTVSPTEAFLNVGNASIDIVPAGTTYTWTVAPNNNVTGETSVATAQTSISQTLTNTTNTVQTVVYTVTPRSGATGNCIGQTFQVSVQVNPKPFILPIPQTVCSASPFTISPANGNGNIVPTGTTYTWTFVDNANVTGEANGTAQTNFTQTLTNTTTIPQVVTYTVTPTSGDAGNCVGSPFTVTITVNPTPVISAKELLICSEDTFNFTLTDGANGDKIPTGTKYTWTVIPNPSITGAVNQTIPQNSILITQALVNTGTAVETITYQVTPTSATGCSGVSFNLVVTVKPPIVINGEPFSYNGFGISCFGANDGKIDINPTGGKLPTDPAGYTYSWTGPNGFASTDQDIEDLVPGTYTVIVNEGSGICTQTKTFVVTEPQPVVITETISNYNGFEISCFGASDGNINLSVTGGTSTYTYLWTATLGGLVPAGMETAANLTGVRAGTYSVKVLDSNGCEKIETYELRQPAPVAISEVVPNRRNILCYGEATGNITVLGSGGIKQYTFTVTGTDYTGTAVSLTSGPTNLNLFSFSALKAGTYVLTLTDLNGCQKSVAPITLTQPLAPLQISNEVLSNYNGFNIACFGDTNGSISHQVSGGTAPYRYAWTGPNGYSSTSLNLTNLAAGSYTLTITDAVNCKLVKTYEMRGPDPIAVDAVKQNVLCGGELSGNIFIRNVTGGTGTYEFLWLKDGVGEIKRSLVAEDLRNIGPGRYILLITDQNFCEYIQIFDVTEPVPLVTTLVKKENNLCFGESKGSIQINIAGGTAPYRYAWTGPGGYTSTNKDLTGLLSGTYEVAVTDALLCTSTLSVTITQPTEIIVTPTLTMVSCPDGKDGAISMTVSGGIPPYVYAWIGPNGFRSTTRDLSNLAAGNYDLVITDGIGCKITRTFEITDPEPIVLTPTISNFNGFEISCKNGSDGVIDLGIKGGNGGYKIFWEGPNGFRSNLAKIVGLVAGTYDVTVVDSKNCISKATYTLDAPEELLITKDDVKITDVSCFDGRDGTLTVTIKKASVGPYRYELSGTSVTGFPVLESILSNNLSYSFTGLRAGSYTLRVSDANGCALSELSGLVVTQPSAPLGFTILKTDNLCYRANNGTIRITPTGGTAPYTILWSNLSQAFTQQNLAPGTYTATLTDAKGCTIAISTEIKEAPIYDLTETVKNISCFGKKDGSIQLNIIGGKAPLKIEWAHGPQEPTLNNLDKGVYSVVITDAGGCKIERQFVINEPQPLDLSATVTDALDCVDPNSGSINITPFGGTPPYTYNWSNGSKTQNLSAISPGSYSLELLDKNGCRILKQFTVIRPIPLEVNVAQTTERVCNPRGLKSNFKVTVKGGIAPYTVTWNRGTATNAGLVMDTQEVGVFIVTVTDARGCIQTKRMEVIETDPLIPEFDYKSASYDLTFENLVNFEVQFKNLSVGKYKEASWDFGDGGSSLDKDPKKKYAKAGTYIVQLKLKDLDGCVVTYSKEIVITDYYLQFPNVFTPNDDSVNDFFYPKFIFIQDIHVTIINKWGELVYESKDLDALGWDGLHNGERAPIGNYVCRVRHTTLDGRKIDQSAVFYLGR